MLGEGEGDSRCLRTMPDVLEVGGQFCLVLDEACIDCIGDMIFFVISFHLIIMNMENK